MYTVGKEKMHDASYGTFIIPFRKHDNGFTRVVTLNDLLIILSFGGRGIIRNEMERYEMEDFSSSRHDEN